MDQECTMLGEYLEAWNEMDYQLDDNSILNSGPESKVQAAFSINSKYLHRLSLLKESNTSQNFTLRLFGFEYYNLNEITNILEDSGFKFVSLTRDFREIALSYAIAFNSAIRGTPIWTINSTVADPVLVNIAVTKRILDKIYKSHVVWNDTLSSLNVSPIPLQYNNLVDDITTAFEQVPTYSGTKTIPHDYLNHIVNKNDVIEMIDSYASGL
jgi:hypothetical protein